MEGRKAGRSFAIALHPSCAVRFARSFVIDTAPEPCALCPTTETCHLVDGVQIAKKNAKCTKWYNKWRRKKNKVQKPKHSGDFRGCLEAHIRALYAE